MIAKFSEADDNGEKHIIPCRAILCNVEKVVTGSQQYYPSGIEFYTGADDSKNHPKCYVVWSSVMNRHIIPECVVSFKSSINVPETKLGGIHFKRARLSMMLQIYPVPYLLSKLA